MKTFMTLFVASLIYSNAFGQIAYLHYRHVPAEHTQTFEELETKYWSKLAKSAIDKGQMSGWSLWRKVGVTEVGAPNYVFVNNYESASQLDNDNIWASNMDALGANPGAVSTMAISTLTFDYYCNLLEAIGSNDYRYAIVNYAKPVDLAGFITENRELWKPMHEKNIKNGTGGMVSWGMMSTLHPQGNADRFSVLTWDGFNKMSDVMKYLGAEGGEISDELASTIEKSKMGEIMPNGFQYRIIYEKVMAIGADN